MTARTVHSAPPVHFRRHTKRVDTRLQKRGGRVASPTCIVTQVREMLVY